MCAWREPSRSTPRCGAPASAAPPKRCWSTAPARAHTWVRSCAICSMPVARCAAMRRCSRWTRGCARRARTTGTPSTSTRSSPRAWSRAWMRPSRTSRATAPRTPNRSSPRTAPPPSASCSASTAPSCCITRPPSLPTAVSSAWARRSASPPTAFTPAGRSGSSNSPATSTSCAARDRCAPEGLVVPVSASCVRGRGGAALAIDPTGVTAQVVLLLPDRHALLDLVNDVAAGEKRLVAMRCAHSHLHRQLADRKLADAVQARGVRHAKARDRLGEDALTFANGERLEGLVLQAPHAHALVGIAHPAFERRVSAAGRISELRAQSLWLDGRVGEAEHGACGGASSTTGDRRNEHHRIAVRERCRPLAELGVYRDSQHVRGQRERIACGQLRIQLARRARGALQRLLAPSGLLTQQREVLHRDVPGGRRALSSQRRHGRSILLGCVDVVECARVRLIEQQRVGAQQELARALLAGGDVRGER